MVDYGSYKESPKPNTFAVKLYDGLNLIIGPSTSIGSRSFLLGPIRLSARIISLMSKKNGEVCNPFVCSVADSTFIIRFFADHELHIFTCKSDKSYNFTEKVPFGTSPCLCKGGCSDHKAGDPNYV